MNKEEGGILVRKTRASFYEEYISCEMSNPKRGEVSRR
jgi:hypothetical protein